MTFSILLALLMTRPVSGAAPDEGIKFGADYYERSLEANIVRGSGNAWMESSDRKVWADQIEIDFTIRRAFATGNVRVIDSQSDITCRRLSYSLDGKETILDDATVVSGQMVLQGKTIQRIGKTHYDIDSGSYTNCGITPLSPSCVYDWRLYGRHFSIDVGAYAHISDVLILVKDVPLFYSPYLIVPIKSDRQTGFLLPSFSRHSEKGSGITLPFFWALDYWHDLSIIPTYFTRTGHHVGLEYRYAYSRDTFGFLNGYFMHRRFGNAQKFDPDDNKSRPLTAGFIGEWAIHSQHRTQLSDRSFLDVDLRAVSNPLYTVDYGNDIRVHPDLASIRSQMIFNHTTDTGLTGIGAIYHQSLIQTKDSGVDGGANARFPLLLWSKSNTPVLGRILSFEIDTELANFYRGGSGFDNIPDSVSNNGTNIDPDPGWDNNDVIRTGQRLFVEPRLVTSVPMPPGFQFQPLWAFGFLGYHFSIPSDKFVSRQYSSVELPLSIYLSRVYGSAPERLSHVLQPRVVYSKNLYQSDVPTHPFFEIQSRNGIRPPRFDLKDFVLPYEFLRLELISRLRRKDGQNSSRVLLVQLSEQYNIRSAQDDARLGEDPRFAKSVGPIDLLTELSLGSWTGQLQASYQLEPTTFNGRLVRESDWSGGIEYRPHGQDIFGLSTRFINRADETRTEQTVQVNFVKTTSTFFNFEGNAEYSIFRQHLVRFSLGTLFSRKPASCWNVLLRLGGDRLESAENRTFNYNLYFKLDFGTPTRMMRDT